MKTVIGMDIGNCYSQTCCIFNMNPTTRMGGNVLYLHDTTRGDPNGIPTTFFYHSKRNGGQPLYGYQAATATPANCRVRYLKRHMRDSVKLDDKTFTYAEMLTQTAQYIIRLANAQLAAQTQLRTNLVALAYPVNFEARDRALLKELVERATLEDGTHIKVVGTIKEPAAAALDYLAEHPGTAEVTKVLAYDLGGGTFDASVVQVFPKGRRAPNGSTYYYDVSWDSGIADLGGKEFDQIVYNMIVKQAGFTPKGTTADTILREAEVCKRNLTDSREVYPDIVWSDGEFRDIVITREAFNREALHLVLKTVDTVKKALNDPNVPKPDLILLTGGASQMPIVKETLEKELPAYRNKIIFHNPSKAIAQGAARFAIDELDDSITTPAPAPVVQRTTFDLGTRCMQTKILKEEEYIHTLIPRGTVLPCNSGVHQFYTHTEKQQYVDMDVYEAASINPVKTQIQHDYKNVLPHASFNFGRMVRRGTCVECQMIVDKDNILYVHAWEKGKRKTTEQVWKCIYEEWRNKSN